MKVKLSQRVTALCDALRTAREGFGQRFGVVVVPNPLSRDKGPRVALALASAQTQADDAVRAIMAGHKSLATIAVTRAEQYLRSATNEMAA